MPYITRLTLLQIKLSSTILRHLLCPPTSDNIQKLKELLLDQFATTVFDNSGKFLTMSGSSAHIHLKEGAIPKAKHNPISVLNHFKEEVKKALWDDVKSGIVDPVPIGTPTN